MLFTLFMIVRTKIIGHYSLLVTHYSLLITRNKNTRLKPFRTLGHIFAKPKDRVPTDRKTHAVYSIPCGDCEKVYLDQTKRQFCTPRNIKGLFQTLTAQKYQLWLSTCVEQTITIRGKILEPLKIVMVNGFVAGVYILQ